MIHTKPKPKTSKGVISDTSWCLPNLDPERERWNGETPFSPSHKLHKSMGRMLSVNSTPNVFSKERMIMVYEMDDKRTYSLSSFLKCFDHIGYGKLKTNSPHSISNYLDSMNLDIIV